MPEDNERIRNLIKQWKKADVTDEAIPVSFQYGYRIGRGFCANELEDFLRSEEKEKSSLKIGQEWFVKLPGKTNLSRVCITDLSKKTVHFKVVGRFLIAEVEFVEKVQ
jgi:hypothetical protein